MGSGRSCASQTKGNGRHQCRPCKLYLSPTGPTRSVGLVELHCGTGWLPLHVGSWGSSSCRSGTVLYLSVYEGPGQESAGGCVDGWPRASCAGCTSAGRLGEQSACGRRSYGQSGGDDPSCSGTGTGSYTV